MESLLKPFVSEHFMVTVQVSLVLAGALAVDFVQRRVWRHLDKAVAKSAHVWDDALYEALPRPLGLLIWVVAVNFAAHLAAAENHRLLNLVDSARSVAVILLVSWFLFKLIRSYSEKLVARGEATGDPVDRHTVDAVSKLLRITVVIATALTALQTLGVSVSGVLAFGGVGGIAVGFAARDLLANFFGGLTIYLDRPFSVGDSIRLPERNVEGAVERIGWRVTCIRNGEKRPLYIPNSTFSSLAVENSTRMSHRRIREVVGLRYDDFKRLPAILDEVKEMLESHPSIDGNERPLVAFDAFGASSLNFILQAFTITTDGPEFHRVKQEILFKVGEIVERHGAEFAFPTTTLHIPSALETGFSPMAVPTITSRVAGS